MKYFIFSIILATIIIVLTEERKLHVRKKSKKQLKECNHQKKEGDNIQEQDKECMLIIKDKLYCWDKEKEDCIEDLPNININEKESLAQEINNDIFENFLKQDNVKEICSYEDKSLSYAYASKEFNLKCNFSVVGGENIKITPENYCTYGYNGGTWKKYRKTCKQDVNAFKMGNFQYLQRRQILDEFSLGENQCNKRCKKIKPNNAEEYLKFSSKDYKEEGEMRCSYKNVVDKVSVVQKYDKMYCSYGSGIGCWLKRHSECELDILIKADIEKEALKIQILSEYKQRSEKINEICSDESIGFNGDDYYVLVCQEKNGVKEIISEYYCSLGENIGWWMRKRNTCKDDVELVGEDNFKI
jgi:hypothetical protein